MAIGAEHGSNLQLNALTQAVVRQLRDRLAGTAGIQ